MNVNSRIFPRCHPVVTSVFNILNSDLHTGHLFNIVIYGFVKREYIRSAPVGFWPFSHRRCVSFSDPFVTLLRIHTLYRFSISSTIATTAPKPINPIPAAANRSHETRYVLIIQKQIPTKYRLISNV